MIRVEREKCCDEMAVARLGMQAKIYSTTLVNTVERIHGTQRLAPSLAIASPARTIEERIRTMMTPGKQFHARPNLVVAAAVMTLAACLIAPTAVVLTTRPQMVSAAEREPNELLLGCVEYVDHFSKEEYLATCCSVDISPDGRHLYAAAPFSNAVSVFERDAVTGYFENIQIISDANTLSGAGSLHLSPNGQYAVATSGRSNTVHLFVRDQSTGRLTALDTIQSGEDGVNHLEEVVNARFSPDSRFVYVIANGSATVTACQITDERQLTTVQCLQGEDNCFDRLRDMVISPDGEYIYVIAFQAGTLVVLDRDRSTGRMAIKQVISHHPGLAKVRGVTCSPEGRFIYTNGGRQRGRGNEAVCVFKRMSDGALESVQHVDTRPLGLASGQKLCTSPDGKHLYVLGARSNAMAVFQVDGNTGRLNHRQTWSAKKIEFHSSPVDVCVSPDGQYVYTAGAGLGVNGIIILKRQTGKSRGAAYDLFKAACSEDAKQLQSMVERGANLDTRQERGYTALHWAVQNGQPGAVERLLKAGAAIDVRAHGDERGWTPLHIAVRQRHRELAAYLIARGADIEAVNRDNRQTPLQITHRAGNLALAEFLIDKGANVNAANEWGNTLMHDVAMSGDSTFGELLCRKGADVNIKQNYGWTPLLFAVRGNNQKLVEWLVSKGADVNGKTETNWTPLHFLSRSGKAELVELFLSKGANPEVENRLGQRPIHCAVMAGSSGAKVIEALVAGGADINALTRRGKTALHLACSRQGNKEAVRVLLAQGAKTEIKDRDGKTPLDLAKENELSDIIALFQTQDEI